MKYAIKRFLFCIVFYLSSHAQSAQELFLQANQAYMQHDYAHAIDIYHKIKDKGPAVWYNMGNSFYKTDQPVYAYLFWRRAQKQASKKLWYMSDHNCSLVREHLPLSDQSAFVSQLLRWYDCSCGFISLIWFQLFFLFFWFLLLFSGLKYSGINRWVFMLLVILATSSAIVLGVKYYLCNRILGVIVAHEVPLYVGPGNTYHAILNMPYGKELLIKKQCENWYQVQDGARRGWIQKDACECI